MAEHHEQTALINWFRYKYPKVKNYLFAIPNGGVLCDIHWKKRKDRMRFLYEEGFRAGVSDLLLALPTAKYAGLWLEMKDLHKTICALTLEQKKFLNDMRDVGYAATWAAGFTEAAQIIDKYMAEYNAAGMPKINRPLNVVSV